MRILYTLSLLATVTSIVSSQAMVPTSGSGTFPACAVSCPILLQVQKICTPPNAAVTNQQRYNDCFCQAPPLDDLYTTGETLCTSQCTATADRQLLSTWFATFCKQVESGANPAGTATTLTTSTTSAATATAPPLVSSNSTTSNGPWIKTHWQWIIMLIFLFFGLLALGLGARWLKQRHDRKNAEKRAVASGFPVTSDKKVDREAALSPESWGPHQHQAATKGHSYPQSNSLPIINEDSNQDSASQKKDNRASRIEVMEIQPVPPAVHSKPPRL